MKRAVEFTVRDSRFVSCFHAAASASGWVLKPRPLLWGRIWIGHSSIFDSSLLFLWLFCSWFLLFVNARRPAPGGVFCATCEAPLWRLGAVSIQAPRVRTT